MVSFKRVAALCCVMILVCGILLAATPRAEAAVTLWAMSGSGDGNLWTIDAGSNTTTLIGAIKDPVLGDVGAGQIGEVFVGEHHPQAGRNIIASGQLSALDDLNRLVDHPLLAE